METYTYDCHIVNPYSLFAGLTLKLRPDCDWYVMVFDSNNNPTYIYLTNCGELRSDTNSWIRKNLDPEGDGLKLSIMKKKGLQFSVRVNRGILFDSRTYIRDSLKSGGFSSYGIK